MYKDKRWSKVVAIHSAKFIITHWGDKFSFKKYCTCYKIISMMQWLNVELIFIYNNNSWFCSSHKSLWKKKSQKNELTEKCMISLFKPEILF